MMALTRRAVRAMLPNRWEKQTNLGGCRPEEGKNDTVPTFAWPKEDRITWVEWRIRERTIREGKYVDQRGKWLLEEKAAGGRKLAPGDEVADYGIWLLKDRDGLSWHQIAYRFFPAATEEEIETFESRVRRAYDRVERSHPGSKNFKPGRLSEEDKLLLQAVSHGAILIPSSAGPDGPENPLVVHE
jgi:hypothetical protein